MSGCYCGEFDRPTIAPDEFGETCFHDRDKCEVPPVPVPMETVLRLTRARAEKAEAEVERLNRIIRESLPYIDIASQLNEAEAAIQRVRGVVDLWQRHDPRRWHDSSIRHPADIPTVAIVAVRRALDGDA